MSEPDTSPATFLDGRVVLHAGNCLEVLAGMPEDSIDAVVTDPPYHLTSIVKRFGGKAAKAAKAKQTGVYKRTARGFMGKAWDGAEDGLMVAFEPETWAAVLRVLKPGGHLLAFNASRNVHRMATAIEDAGFEIRDRLLRFVAADAAVCAFLDTLSEAQVDAFLECIERSQFGGELAWVFGSGFPKSHDVSKAIDKMLMTERQVVASRTVRREGGQSWAGMVQSGMFRPSEREQEITEPATDEAREWDGWGTALKPAYEPIIMARKPLAEGSVVAQVLKTGTGAINVGACEIGTEGGTRKERSTEKSRTDSVGGYLNAEAGKPVPGKGRWPASVLHDGSDDVVAEFPAEAGGGNGGPHYKDTFGDGTIYGKGSGAVTWGHADSGSAARFFYSSKAGGDDRLGSKHPTVKPVDLMQWLVRLVCRKGGTVLDPFAGTGTTGEAAFREGCNAVLIEREAEYREDIARRMKLALAGARERKTAQIEARGPVPAIEESPLFALGALYSHEQENCPGHVASPQDSKICARCGVHIDELRPSEE